MRGKECNDFIIYKCVIGSYSSSAYVMHDLSTEKDIGKWGIYINSYLCKPNAREMFNIRRKLNI